MKFILEFTLVMLMTTTINVFWTYYILHINEGNKWRASMFATLIAGGQGFIVTSYVENKIFLLAASVGAFFGVFLPLMYNEYKKKNVSKV